LRTRVDDHLSISGGFGRQGFLRICGVMEPRERDRGDGDAWVLAKLQGNVKQTIVFVMGYSQDKKIGAERCTALSTSTKYHLGLKVYRIGWKE